MTSFSNSQWSGFLDFFAGAAVSQRLFEPAVIGRKKWDVFLMNS
jgi:hypothetical protein